jgi:hypothetical protein
MKVPQLTMFILVEDYCLNIETYEISPEVRGIEPP